MLTGLEVVMKIHLFHFDIELNCTSDDGAIVRRLIQGISNAAAKFFKPVANLK